MTDATTDLLTETDTALLRAWERLRATLPTATCLETLHVIPLLGRIAEIRRDVANYQMARLEGEGPSYDWSKEGDAKVTGNGTLKGHGKRRRNKA